MRQNKKYFYSYIALKRATFFSRVAQLHPTQPLSHATASFIIGRNIHNIAVSYSNRKFLNTTRQESCMDLAAIMKSLRIHFCCSVLFLSHNNFLLSFIPMHKFSWSLIMIILPPEQEHELIVHREFRRSPGHL